MHRGKVHGVGVHQVRGLVLAERVGDHNREGQRVLMRAVLVAVAIISAIIVVVSVWPSALPAPSDAYHESAVVDRSRSSRCNPEIQIRNWTFRINF